MHTSPHSAYLETQVVTATPQRLRLMLIEDAVRHANRLYSAALQQRRDEALEALIRVRSLVAELISGIRPGSSPLASRVLGIYAFLFEQLADAALTDHPEKIAELIPILEEERQTWQQLCEQLPEAPTASADSSPREILAPTTLPSAHFGLGTPQSSICLDA